MASIEELEVSLTAATQRAAMEVGKAKSAAARLNGVKQAILKRAVDQSNLLVAERLAELMESNNPEAYNWDNQAWANFQPNGSLISNRIRIGREVEKTLEGEVNLDLPISIPLLGSDGAIVLVHDTKSAPRARAMMQSILLRASLLMINQLRLTLLDPSGMGAAFPFRGFLGRDIVRTAGRGSAEELAEVVDDIRRINERVIGDADRLLSLSPEKRSGETFELVAAAGFPGAYSKDPRAIESLVRIANAGPRAGRHLIVEWNNDDQLPHDFQQSAFQNATIVDVRSFSFDSPKKSSDPMKVLDGMPDGAQQKVLIEAAFAGAKARDGGDWNSIVRPETLQTQSSILRVETPIGERLRFWLGESDDGKQSTHAMIAGQVGSGKSYLLHVLILGLAARYSPDELQLTLIDGKQGVEFEAYRNLPHSDVVCLRTAPALARSVLSDYVQEMERRYELFQMENVVKLADYRTKTHKALPRCVLVVDEYQQILDGDPEGGAQMLGRLLEKGRAAGMHVVLGSQTFEQRGLPTSALSHIHTWGALSLAESYSQSIQVFGPEGKRLIRDLGSMAEVVLNDEGGRDGANARGAVARLRDKEGKDLLPDIVSAIVMHSGVTDRMTEGGSVRKPIVLSGREGAQISDNFFVAENKDKYLSAKELEELARSPANSGGFGQEFWNASDRPIPLWFGRRFDVRGHALVTMRRAPAQNMLVVGNQVETRCRMLGLGLAALGTALSPDDLEIYFLDGLRDDMPGGGMVKAGLDRLSEAGFKVHYLSEESFLTKGEVLQSKTTSSDPKGPSRLLVISDPDYLYSLHAADRFNIPSEGAPAILRQIIQRGPQAGIHTILSVAGLSSFQLILSPTREAQVFNHRIVQQMNEDEAMTLFSSLAAARLADRADHPFTSLYVDQQFGVRNAVLFHAYAGSITLGKDQGVDAMLSQLAKIQFPKV